MGKKGVILWDIDGTLLFNTNESRMSVHSAALELIGVNCRKNEHKLTGLTDYEAITQLIKSNIIEVHNETLMDVFIELDKCYFQNYDDENLSLHPGVTVDLMNKLGRDWELGIITGNTTFRAFLKLNACGLLKHLNPNLIFTSKFGDTRIDITQRAKKAIDRDINLRNNKKFVVGDTLYDIEAGIKAGFKVISIATGDYSYSELNSRNPDMVIRNLQIDIKKFYEVLSRS